MCIHILQYQRGDLSMGTAVLEGGNPTSAPNPRSVCIWGRFSLVPVEASLICT